MTADTPSIDPPDALPIDAVLPDLKRSLEISPNAVLIAAPGAGKTTRVPLALLDASWRGDGRILVLEPRRLAARTAARRMAQSLGESVGRTVGYRVRMESRVSAQTRIEVLTEGVFTKQVLNNPDLSGISAILFDEFHERSLDGDLGLALALDVQGALREDLRLIVMSATLDKTGTSRVLGNAPVIVSEGRQFPIETRYLGRKPQQRIEEAMAEAIVSACRTETGSILAFLPGMAEIRRTEALIKARLPDNTIIAPLYGALDFAAQDVAINPSPQGKRKIVLATNIAETSLTIEGIRIVIDSGLSRVPRYEPATGLTRLETGRAAIANIDQRRGRAGRTEPGICLRLWNEAQTRSLPDHENPEILAADLTDFVLNLAGWGVTDPDQLSFIDPPPSGALAEARTLLTELDAIDPEGRITATGRSLSNLPVHPRLAYMMIIAGDLGLAALGAEIALLLGERNLGGTSTDIRSRITTFRRDRGDRAKRARSLANQWLKQAGLSAGRSDNQSAEHAGQLLALAYPDRIAEARGAAGTYRLANGRGARIDDESPLFGFPFLVTADLQGSAAHSRILLAAPITLSEIEDLFRNRIVEEENIHVTDDGTAKAETVRRLNKLVLSREPLKTPCSDKVVEGLLTHIRKKGIGCLRLSPQTRQWRQRVDYLQKTLGPPWPDLSDARLQETLSDWLGPYLSGKTALSDIKSDELQFALETQLPYELKASLSTLAPSHFKTPTGSRIAIDYGAEAGPTLSVRVQELFGLSDHPSLANGRLPLILELLSPAHRPIQVTKDLPRFWAGSWADVKAEMRGRYPKHPWPDDPITAEATKRAKPRKK